MSQIKRTFAALNGRKALIPFITAGHPQPEMTVAVMHELVAQGADIIELGMPFSDPMADGPVIQQSSEQAIAQGIGIEHTIDMVEQFRANNQHTPVVLMGYLNPVECMGHEAFVKRAKAAGVDAVLLVDSPPEESDDLLQHLKASELEQIFLIAPTTTDERQQMICEHASGFVYYVALKGVTGAADLDATSVVEDVKHIRTHTDLPVAVGFGVKDAESAVAVAAGGDAVVIGSALVSLLDGCENLDQARSAIEGFIKPIREALDSL